MINWLLNTPIRSDLRLLALLLVLVAGLVAWRMR